MIQFKKLIKIKLSINIKIILKQIKVNNMNWMKNCYSRLLIDNHITECDDSFMTRFDPATYAKMAKKAQIDSAMVYACCHNGNCYYPTKVGHMHKNLNGRDIFGETIESLKKENIVPIAYTTVIYHNDSAKNNSGWRTKDIDGKEHHGRYWFSCPNNRDYVEFTKKQCSEIISYDIKGIFIDMTFWPMICYCDSCRQKYKEEFDSAIPETIDWNDSKWTAFQRARERWMGEFAMTLSSHIKNERPELTAVHQFSPVLHGWFLGQSAAISDASDYSSGDFYGGIAQQRFGVKAFAAFSEKTPYEFMTSRCVNLRDHTSTKSEEELFCHAATTLANGGAYFFIDAINPDGTLCGEIYEKLGKVSEKLRPFKDFIQKNNPEIAAETGLYFSMKSCVNFNIGKVEVKRLNESSSNMNVRKTPHLDEAMGTAQILNKCHIPYKVITEKTHDFSDFKTIIINNAMFLSEDEIERIRRFVEDGGTLIATGLTSLYCNDKSDGNFALKDVFGLSFAGKMSKKINYLTIDFDKNSFVSCQDSSPLVKVVSANPVAFLTEPHFKCNDENVYASIHSNPPGVLTEYCALAENKFGKGKCVYFCSSIMSSPNHAQQEYIASLFQKHIKPLTLVSTNAPSCIETTILKSSDSNSLILCMVNFQEQLPNVPAHDIELVLDIPEVSSILKVSDGSEADFYQENEKTIIKLDKLDVVEMFEIKCGG